MVNGGKLWGTIMANILRCAFANWNIYCQKKKYSKTALFKGEMVSGAQQSLKEKKEVSEEPQ